MAGRELVIRRTFDAPRELVWMAFSDPVHAKRWWGPEGFTATRVELATEPGGAWRAEMVDSMGKVYGQGGVLREIVPPERLVYTFVWDESPDVEMLIEVSFAERGGKTEMTMRQTGFPSAESRDGHAGGWNETFDRMRDYLTQLCAARQT